MPVLGLRGTGSFSSDERPKNYRSTLMLLNPNTKAPLTALLGMLRNEPTDDPEFKVFTKGLPAQRATVSGTHNTTVTTITLQGTSQNQLFKTGHAVINETTGEVVWVASSATSNTLIVERAKGSTAVAMATGQGMFILGSHHEEGAAVPAAISYDPSVVTNYTQIFRTSLNLTGTAQATRLRYSESGPLREMRREALEIHAIEQEKQYLFGSGVEDTTGSHPERTTKGMFFFVTSNLLSAAGTIDVDTWENFLEDIFEDGSNEKLVLGGNRLINVLNKVARAHGSIELTPRSDTFGLMMQTYLTPYGTLQIKQHALLSKNASFNDWGFVIDPAHIVYRFLRGRDTRYLQNRQSNGDDATKDEYMTESGLQVEFEQVHGVAKDLTAFAA